MSNTLRHLRRLVFCLVALMPAAHAQEKELMIYCGITMVRPITELARQFDPGFDASTIELRDSRAGNYLGVTITITATSREQLDGLYSALTSHPLVKIVL